MQFYAVQKNSSGAGQSFFATFIIKLFRQMELPRVNELLSNQENLLPANSIECVIFTFIDNQLKVLLNKIDYAPKLMLPGGFVFKNENFDEAAKRLLVQRAGIKNLHFEQFYTFSSPSRDRKDIEIIINRLGIQDNAAFFKQRFVATAYYALADSKKVQLNSDSMDDNCDWVRIDRIPPLLFDHKKILKKAIETLQMHLRYKPIGINLLPKKFTMPELQALYEIILDKKLDRRNFQRKIMSYDILIPLNEKKKGSTRRPPLLYSFDVKKYNASLKGGLQDGF